GRLAARHGIQECAQTLAEGCVRAATALETSVDVIQLTESERRLQIGEPKVRSDPAVDISPPPVEIALIDVGGGSIEHVRITRDERAALAGGQDFRDAERKR